VVSEWKKALRHTEEGTHAQLFLSLLQQCRELSLPKLIHDPLLEAFKRSLVWGSNVISTLIVAYENDLLDAAEECLKMVSDDLKTMKLEMEHARELAIVKDNFVCALESFSSCGCKISASASGRVLKIDEEGDAEIIFCGDSGSKFVDSHDFDKLVVLADRAVKRYPSDILTLIKDQVAQAAIQISFRRVGKPNANSLKQLMSVIINAGAVKQRKPKQSEA